jgi:peptidoglycan hydrolase CwlO-like protein
MSNEQTQVYREDLHDRAMEIEADIKEGNCQIAKTKSEIQELRRKIQLEETNIILFQNQLLKIQQELFNTN